MSLLLIINDFIVPLLPLYRKAHFSLCHTFTLLSPALTGWRHYPPLPRLHLFPPPATNTPHTYHPVNMALDYEELWDMDDVDRPFYDESMTNWVVIIVRTDGDIGWIPEPFWFYVTLVFEALATVMKLNNNLPTVDAAVSGGGPFFDADGRASGLRA